LQPFLLTYLEADLNLLFLLSNLIFLLLEAVIDSLMGLLA